MTQRFTIAPDPPTEGQQATICYAFAGLDPAPDQVVITIDYSPANIPNGQVIVTPDNNCATFTVPTGATSGIAVDSTGNSDDFGFAVQAGT